MDVLQTNIMERKKGGNRLRDDDWAFLLFRRIFFFFVVFSELRRNELGIGMAAWRTSKCVDWNNSVFLCSDEKSWNSSQHIRWIEYLIAALFAFYRSCLAERRSVDVFDVVHYFRFWMFLKKRFRYKNCNQLVVMEIFE